MPGINKILFDFDCINYKRMLINNQIFFSYNSCRVLDVIDT